MGTMSVDSVSDRAQTIGPVGLAVLSLSYSRPSHNAYCRDRPSADAL